MLNISDNKLNTKVDISHYESSKRAFGKSHYKNFNRLLLLFAVLCVIILFLPWTQNITANGAVTTLTPDQRPQSIQSPIPGRIEKWYVKEGDFVKKGDTILFVSEVKNDYFNPDLVKRTGEQIQSKNFSVESYGSKVNALDNQIAALQRERLLKLEQAKNKLLQSKLKVKSDSIDYEASKTNLNIAEKQFSRIETLQNEGLKSVTEVEEKRLKLQETQAKIISLENKYLAAKNEVLNAEVEINRIQAEYIDKISKAQSDKFTAKSNQFDTEAQVSKLENDYANYEMRRAMYYIKAPLDGYINKAIKTGIGESFKEGERLVGIMPANYDIAVETYIKPIDLPLVHLGETFRVQFDGWPAVVFSGWPNVSFGTYGAKVVAIESFISDNGKFRILLARDETDYAWPEAIRVGSGVKALGLLDDVPIWFELWRKLNGFPPNYYQPQGELKKDSK
ncbi:biotin/lipoyl-binding protein [Lacinutrix neustonica]|uniref:Biotin/lipoyl-binding protein n=1 Tax=Lacinutrix neustonica TaxID=2980107 RepID=A0A9E8MWA4_9FLAO|nr:biotin/lipoyl-binding protein [Lacinutrix neustonica]WAC02531.1 biotin/lipoyl-binding protein [Lacinutrix neustonica]